jgi:hypothetical protein
MAFKMKGFTPFTKKEDKPSLWDRFKGQFVDQSEWRSKMNKKIWEKQKERSGAK